MTNEQNGDLHEVFGDGYRALSGYERRVLADDVRYLEREREDYTFKSAAVELRRRIGGADQLIGYVLVLVAGQQRRKGA